MNLRTTRNRLTKAATASMPREEARLAIAAVSVSGLLILAGFLLIASSAGLRPVAGFIPGLAMLAAGALALSVIYREIGKARHIAIEQQQRQKQREILSLLLTNASGQCNGWLWETDSAGQFTFASEGLLQVWNRSLPDPVGQNFDALVVDGAASHGWLDLKAALFRRKPVDGIEIELPTASGPSWWRIKAQPAFAIDGTFQGYRGVALDITGDHGVQAEMALAKAEAERQNASKSHFLAVMSHELRTPLNAIVGFAELLSSAAGNHLDERTRAEHLRIVLDSSRHLLALINDILDVSRIEKGTMTLVEQEADAGELLEIAVKMCRQPAEAADVTIVARIADGIVVNCDMTRIKQVLTNLVTNAIKFSPKSGCVTVSLDGQPGGPLIVAVRDHGVGIAEADIERIFEPYVQVDEGAARRYGGAGLGLAISRRIAELHGGNVTIESELGKGTTARLMIPAERVMWPMTPGSETSRAA